MTLAELRDKLDSLDRQFVEMIAQRQSVIREIARVKQATGSALRDYTRERQVLEKARTNAEQSGISPDVAESAMRLLISYSLTMQEKAAMVAHRAGGGQSALVIGGAGKMGNWFAQFLYSQGFEVEIADPMAPPGETSIADWRQSGLQHDYIVVATPLGETNVILHALAERRPAGIVFDVGSLKSPIRSGLEALRNAGVRTASIHPMFGPDVQLLSGRHVVFVDFGDDASLEKVRALFAPTMAEQVTLTVDEHDRMIAFVLGLSHAVNIAFFTALAASGESVPRLMEISSTTFAAQFDIARRVAQENPKLYYEIQRLNDFGMSSLDALEKAVETLRSTVQEGRETDFIELMQTGRTFTANRRRNKKR